MRLNTVSCGKLGESTSLIHGLRAHLDQRLAHNPARDRHQLTHGLRHTHMQDIGVHTGHPNQVFNDRSIAKRHECLRHRGFNHASALKHVSPVVRTLNVDGIHGFKGVGDLGEYRLKPSMGTLDHSGFGAVNRLYFVGAQMIHHGTVRANGVGVKIGLFPQWGKPTARAPGHEHDVDARRTCRL